MRKTILFLGTLLAGVVSASASATVQGWWHYGELPDYYADSSGNGRRFSMAFSSVGGGNAGAGVVPFGIGATLSGFVSTNSLYWTPTHATAAAMWYPATASTPEAEWNPPATNYIIECYVLPEGKGIAGSALSTWFFASGSGDFSQPSRPARTGAGGVFFRITHDESVGTSQFGAFVIPNAAQGVPEEVQIGDWVEANTNRWMHLAVVNEDGTNTFYVDGAPHGEPQPLNTIPNGNIFAGGSPGTSPTFAGYLDELRISTFAPGQFELTDLLLRPPGPSILNQPENVTAWAGGAAPFEVITAFDTGTTYQWRREGASIAGANRSVYVVPSVALGETGNFDVVASSGGASSTSAVATLTVVAPNPSNTAAYQNSILAEPSLVAYFPVDNDTGTTVANAEDNTHNGTMQGTAYFDSRTNRAFGVKALGFDGNGEVVVPSNPAYDFPNGSGTIEAVVHLNRATLTDPTIVTAGDYGAMYYLLGASKDGNSLIYSNDVSGGLSWPLPQTLVGRRVHLAFVFDNQTNITPYLNGERLATKVQTSFGSAPFSSLYIGSRGTNAPGFGWNGSIDEVALYSAALSETAIQTHYANYFYGTNTAAPAIVSIPPSRTLLAGGSPVLSVVAEGTPPFTYQWTSNGVDIAGATTASLTLANTTPASSADYGIRVSNAFGQAASDPITLTFVAAPTGYAASVLEDSPMAYWRQSETNGSVLVDAAGFFDGIYSGAVALGQPGAFAPDTSVKYEGGKGEIPWSEALNPAGPFSIECWALSYDNSAIRTMFSAQNRSAGRSGYALYHHANVPGFEVHMGDATTVTMFLQDSTPVEIGVWYHVVITYDGTTARLYVDGRMASEASGNYNPNSNKPLTFGQRTDAQWLNNGLLDEVAFYNYALSADQIRDHWSNVWSPAAITQQPVSVTTNEWATITLTGQASGIPNTYHWTQGGNSLVEATNPDGTRHYPNGVTNTTLIISQAVPADSGQYRLVATNPRGNATSDPATVTVTADNQPPVVTSAMALGTPNPAGGAPHLVKVLFNERLTPSTAQLAANYQISGGVTVTGVFFPENVQGGALGLDWRSAVLTTSGLTPGQEYTLTVSNVKDQSSTGGNTIVATPVTFKAPVLQSGSALWDYYYLGTVTASDIGSLLGNPIYPGGPMTNVNLMSFDSTSYTGGDLRGKLGDLGDNYGSSISGWITPTVSGNYTFFLSSDDASELHLSPNANPAEATVIAYEPGCCHAFTEPDTGEPYTSTPQALVAGTSYFFRAVHVEGGGGDYVKVAWRMEGDSTPAGSLTPIPGSFLSSYAAVPAPQFNAPVLGADGKLTLTWTGTGTLEESTNLQTWTVVPGNPVSGVQVDATTGSKFYRLRQ